MLRALPTWLIIRAMTPFLAKSHPWSGRRFSLREWHQGEMPFSVITDWAAWFYLTVGIVLFAL